MEKQTNTGFFASPQQKNLWLQQEQNDPSCFLATLVLSLEGTVEIERLRQAIRQIVSRHDSLRTVFYRQPGMKIPFQVILEESDPPWETLDQSNSTDTGSVAQKLLAPNKACGFDLQNGPMLHARLAKLTDSKHLLFLTIPSLCCDLRSLSNIATEIVAAYENKIEPVSEDALRYVQFAQWQNDVLESEEEAAREGKAFWQQQLLEEAALPLPLEQRNDEKRPFQPQSLSISISPALVSAIEKTAAAHNASSQDVLLTSWQSLMMRLSGAQQFSMGVVLECREYDELQNIVGQVAKALPIRAKVQPDFRVREAIAAVRAAVTEASGWQEYFAPGTVFTSDAPVAFEYATASGHIETSGSLSVTLLRQYCYAEPFKLKLFCLHSKTDMQTELQYDASRLGLEAAQAIAEEFLVLLEALVANPEVTIGSLPLLTAAQRQQLLYNWNQTSSEYPQQTISQLFELQAEKNPKRTAVVAKDRSLTYLQLNEEANRLAHYLQRLGVGKGAFVGLSVDRSVDMIVAMLAIHKAGGAYVPLNADNPKAHLQQQLSAATVLITEEKLAANMPEVANLLRIDTDRNKWAGESASNPKAVATPEDAVYVIFTSGSTGVPKGVCVLHRNLVNYVAFIMQRLQLDEYPDGLHFATVSTLAADLGNTCIFPALLSGGCLHVLDYETATDSLRMASYQQQHEIDVLKIVPSHLAALLNSPEAAQVLPRKYLVLGGEALTRQLLDKIRLLQPACKILNHYGPTETTVGSLTLKLDNFDWQHSLASSIPIGQPIANTQVYILDALHQPVPVGVTGELFIGGAGVTRGYLNQPQLTAERFLSNPFVSDAEARIYRTGDLARWLPDGYVEFLGRGDDQVKVRGFRIELGEIEAVLSRHSSVRQAILLARESQTGDKQLVAYVVPHRDSASLADDLRAYLKEQLPDYMIPSAIVPLEKLPLNTNGKVDRKALPAPELVLTKKKAYVAPSTPTQQVLVTIWTEILKVDPISIDDNFFDLGGHSLMATQVVSRIREHFSVEIALRVIFETPTIQGIALAVEMAKENGEEADLIVPVSRSAYRRAAQTDK